MPRDTLLDFFEDFSTLKGTFLVHDDGYRVRKVSYRQLAQAASRFAEWLDAHQITAGEKVVIWSENRPEWIAAFWGCLLVQVVVVPVDYRASEDLLRRVAAIVKARAVLVGDAVKLEPDHSLPVYSLHDVVPDGPDSQARPLKNWPRPRDGSALAEIIFTSGATAEPKGVTITHRNVLANLVPIEREIRKYKKYERPFHPIRFFNLLPLSHMFGQSMATFIPPMLDGVVLFSHSYSPAEILHQIKSRRMSVLVCVPKVLDVLREHLLRIVPSAADPDPPGGMHWAMRWWKHRAVHRQFGWKFWCFVSGAAPLDPELEAFWRKLGFVVVQGYGLTETAPIVTLNHPFRASRGTVGKPIAGVEVRIAPDGEVLVRGENVTSGYYKADSGNGAGELTAAAFEDGWS
jgi:long-chain acyl-CoA synthetase